MKRLFGLKDENGKDVVLNVNETNSLILEQQKPKFKAGQWVIWDGCHKAIGRIIKHCNSFENSWSLEVDGNLKTHDSCSEYNLRLATPEEIEDHLIKVAKEKGFKGDLKLHPLNRSCSDHIPVHFAIDIYHYRKDLDRLELNGTGIYEAGKWAIIIFNKKKLPKTKEELKQFVKECNESIYSFDGFIQAYED